MAKGNYCKKLYFPAFLLLVCNVLQHKDEKEGREGMSENYKEETRLSSTIADASFVSVCGWCRGQGVEADEMVEWI